MREPWLKSAEPEVWSEWDTWIAAHDRVVAAQAWDEGWHQGASSASSDEWETTNPYRTEENN